MANTNSMVYYNLVLLLISLCFVLTPISTCKFSYNTGSKLQWHSAFQALCWEIIDEEDEKLQSLKQEWGDEIHLAVVTALKELNEYNASSGNTVNELRNFKEKRKATLKEVISYIVNHIKPLKRKRTKGKRLVFQTQLSSC